MSHVCQSLNDEHFDQYNVRTTLDHSKCPEPRFCQCECHEGDD